MTEKITYHSAAGKGEIILNQPDKRNAINSHMWTELSGLVAKAETDPACKVLIISGAGKHFAAGADISEFEQAYKTRQSAKVYTQTMLDGLSVLEQCSKPTIAAIHGTCIGGGCSIALACDFRFASEDAKFGITPGKLGLVYSLADTRRLIRAVGPSHAKDLLMTGRIINAYSASTMTLIDKIVPADHFDTELEKYIDQLLNVSQWSLRTTKKMIQLFEDGKKDNDQAAMDLMLDAFNGADFKEGYNAFLEKRKPDFPID